MIDSSLLWHFDEIFHFDGQTYVSCKSNFFLMKSCLKVIFSTLKRGIIFLSVTCKIKLFWRSFPFQIDVSFELAYSARTYLISNVKKSHPCALKIRYLFNKITVWIKFLTTESRVNKFSVDLKIKLKSLVLFSKNNLTFSVYFFVKHPVYQFFT